MHLSLHPRWTPADCCTQQSTWKEECFSHAQRASLGWGHDLRPLSWHTQAFGFKFCTSRGTDRPGMQGNLVQSQVLASTPWMHKTFSRIGSYTNPKHNQLELPVLLNIVGANTTPCYFKNRTLQVLVNTAHSSESPASKAFVLGDY